MSILCGKIKNSQISVKKKLFLLYIFLTKWFHEIIYNLCFLMSIKLKILTLNLQNSFSCKFSAEAYTYPKKGNG